MGVYGFMKRRGEIYSRHNPPRICPKCLTASKQVVTTIPGLKPPNIVGVFSMQLLAESNQVAKRVFKSISCQKPDFHILWREREWHLSIQTSPAWCYEDIAMQRLMCSSNVLAMHVAIRLQGFDAQETLLLLHIFVETDK